MGVPEFQEQRLEGSRRRWGKWRSYSGSEQNPYQRSKLRGEVSDAPSEGAPSGEVMSWLPLSNRSRSRVRIFPSLCHITVTDLPNIQTGSAPTSLPLGSSAFSSPTSDKPLGPAQGLPCMGSALSPAESTLYGNTPFASGDLSVMGFRRLALVAVVLRDKSAKRKQVGNFLGDLIRAGPSPHPIPTFSALQIGLVQWLSQREQAQRYR